MAYKHGKDTFVSVAGTDLSQYTMSSEFSRSVDTHDVTGYGSSSKSFIGGLTDATFSMEGNYNDTAGTGPRAVLNANVDGDAIAIIRRPEGTGSGLPEDSFNAILTSYVETSPVADRVTWSAEFQVSGDVTSSTQA